MPEGPRLFAFNTCRQFIVPQWEKNPRLQAKTSVQSRASNAVRHRAACGLVRRMVFFLSKPSPSGEGSLLVQYPSCRVTRSTRTTWASPLRTAWGDAISAAEQGAGGGEADVSGGRPKPADAVSVPRARPTRCTCQAPAEPLWAQPPFRTGNIPRDRRISREFSRHEAVRPPLDKWLLSRCAIRIVQ